ncbi:MAG: pilus assembly protein [Rhodospirillales bacterium]|jgi:Flp pilus assembly protein TadG|nr:pilus assembly protein [Rhodospirillales bacterium]
MIRYFSKIEEAIKVRHLVCSKRGAAAVEFAMLMPIISALFIGVINYGLVVFEKMELSSAAHAGAQMALIDSSDTSVIQQVVVDSTDLNITTSDVAVSEACTCTCTDDTCSGADNEHHFTITVSEDYTLLLVPTTMTLSSSAVIRTE